MVSGTNNIDLGYHMTIDIEARGTRMARLWILIAVTYLLVGAALGVFMGASHQLQYAPVHAHINLLGWATMALAGLIYDRFPQAGGSRLGMLHFWMHNLVLPPTMIMLFIMFSGTSVPDAVVGFFSVLLLLTLVVFASNLYVNLRKTA
jgi:hypothetical protein